MITRLTQDHRHTKESLGSLPTRLPIPKISNKKTVLYAEPATIFQSGVMVALIPNSNRYVNFLNTNSPHSSSPRAVTSGSGSTIGGFTNNRFFTVGSSGGTVRFWVYEFEGKPLSQIRPRIKFTGRVTAGFSTDVIIEVSNEPTGTYTEITNNEWNTLPDAWDSIYVRFRNTGATNETFFVAAQAGDEEGFQRPLEFELR